MTFKPFALSLSAAFIFSGLGCRQEAPTSPAPKPKTSLESSAPAPAARTETAQQNVGSKTGENIEDAVITGKVRAALLKSEEVKGTEINIETRNGVVQLNGFVPTNSDLERAVTLAKQVDGVRAVQNRLAVRSS